MERKVTDKIKWGLIASVIVWIIVNNCRNLLGLAECKDVLFFIVTVATSAIVFLSVVLISDRTKLKINYRIEVLVEAIIVIGAFIWLCAAIENEKFHIPGSGISYFRHIIDVKLYAILLILFSLLFWGVLKDITLNRTMRIALVCGIGFAMSILLIVLNPFYDTGGGFYHIHAYTNSIYNVLNSEPYYLENTSIYGHYALLYFLPVKFLGLFGLNTTTSISIVIFWVGFTCYICAGICIEKLVRNDFVFLITVVSLGEILCQTYLTGQYYQVMPHRILCPMVLLAYCSVHNSRKIYGEFIGWTICALSYIWSFESGLVCSVTWLFYIGSSFLRENSRISNIIKKVVLEVLFAFGAGAIPYFVVNLYNLVCGGSWNSFRTYIFPIGSSVYHIGNLEAALPSINNMWFYYVIIAFCILMAGLWLGVIKKMECHNLIVASCVAINSLGMIVYYINRSAIANLAISFFQTIILTGWLLDYILQEVQNENVGKGKRFVKISQTVFLGCFLFICVFDVFVNYGRGIENRNNYSWRYEDLYDFSQRIQMSLPENVKGIGTGVHEIYDTVDREVGVYYTDWSDMNAPTLDKFQQVVDGEEKIFINQQAAEQLDMRGYYLKGEWQINGFVYNYYSRNPDETLSKTFNKSRLKKLFDEIENNSSIETLDEMLEMKDFYRIYETYVEDYEKQLTDEEYVELLYNSLLLRGISDDESKSICDMLEDGMLTRKDEFYKICYSEEFNNLQY